MNQVELGDGRTLVKLLDGEFHLDFVEAARQLNKVVRDCEAADNSNYEYVSKFAEWVKDVTGVQLRDGQTYQLITAIGESFTAGKGGAAPQPN